MGRDLVDVIPVLVVSSSNEISPSGIYTIGEWVDPGSIKDYNCIFSNLDMENARRIVP